jgi:hypothetical protein
MYCQLLSVFQSRSRRQGFALPLTLIIGLLMLSMGAVTIVRSRADNSKAVTQKNTVVGVGVTEAGIAQYQQIMQKNTNLAYYPTCVNDPANPNPATCDGQSWRNVSAIPGIQACSTGNLNTISAKASTGWQAVDANDPSKGQYRLVSYTYRYFPNASNRNPSTLVAGVGIAPGQGTLIIDGRGADNQDPSMSSSASAVSTSRIEVTIPVEPRQLTNNVPGVWLTEGNLGGNSVQGDVLVNDCGVTLSSINVTGSDPVTNQTYQAQHTTMAFPELPPVPDLPGTGRSSQILGTLTGQDYTFPRPTDTAVTITRTVNGEPVTIANVYEYIVDAIDLQSGNKTLTITPGAKVIFYLRGSILRGSELLHECPPGSTTCKPTNFQIYGYGNIPGQTSYQICLIGNDRLEAFILAPNYTAGVAGSGGGAGGIKGSIWTKEWSNSSGCGSNTSNVVAVQGGRWQDLGLQPRNIPPQIKPATNWNQKEVSP